jgi:hypothetical protein
LDHIEEVTAEVSQQHPLTISTRLGVHPDQDHEQRYQWQRDGNRDGGDEVSTDHAGKNCDRDDDREDKLRQISGEVRIECVEAAATEGQQPARALATKPAGTQPDEVPGQLSTKLGLHCGGRSQCHRLTAVGGERARKND